MPGANGSSIHVNGSFSMSPAQLHTFPPAVQHGILESFVRSLHSVFLLGVPLATVMFVADPVPEGGPAAVDLGTGAPERGRGHGGRGVRSR